MWETRTDWVVLGIWDRSTKSACLLGSCNGLDTHNKALSGICLVTQAAHEGRRLLVSLACFRVDGADGDCFLLTLLLDSPITGPLSRQPTPLAVPAPSPEPCSWDPRTVPTYPGTTQCIPSFPRVSDHPSTWHPHLAARESPPTGYPEGGPPQVPDNPRVLLSHDGRPATLMGGDL